VKLYEQGSMGNACLVAEQLSQPDRALAPPKAWCDAAEPTRLARVLFAHGGSGASSPAVHLCR